MFRIELRTEACIETTSERREELARKIGTLAFVETARPVRILIGGVRADVHVTDEGTESSLRDFFEAYGGEGLPDLRISLHVDAAPTPQRWMDADPEFHEGAFGVVQRDFAARFLDSGHVVGLIPSSLQDAYLNLLRWALPPFLLKRGALLMHASGAVRGRRGHVFFGQSGAGKSTTVSLIQEADPVARVVGDDVVILRLTSEGPRLSTAPLGSGDAVAPPPNLDVPLAGLYSLRQSSKHRVVPLHPGEALRAFLASAMFTAADLAVSPGGADPLATRVELAAEIVRQAGARALEFKKDPGFWNLILKENEA